MNTYNNHFNWDFDKLVVMLLPPVLRKPKLLAFLEVLASGISSVYDGLIEFRTKSSYNAYFSADRITFEHYLNDVFDKEDRNIKVVNAEFLERKTLYKNAENRPNRIYQVSENKPIKLYYLQEYETSIHFIIEMPAGLLNAQQLKALRIWVDERKLPNKNYEIEFI
ncbi:MAG: hypothetical protein ACPGSD_07650 [Flavobacteriales bacterium]